MFTEANKKTVIIKTAYCDRAKCKWITRTSYFRIPFSFAKASNYFSHIHTLFVHSRVFILSFFLSPPYLLLLLHCLLSHALFSLLLSLIQSLAFRFIHTLPDFFLPFLLFLSALIYSQIHLSFQTLISYLKMYASESLARHSNAIYNT